MHSLPVEVLEVIFSLVDTHGVRALFHVSRLLRRVILWELLSRYDLSMAQIHSGETSLSSGAYFLIPTILRIHPIRELVVVESDNRRLRVLADVLRRTPIPYVRVLGKISEEDRPSSVISALSHDGKDTIVIVGRNIRLSLPCRIIPFRRRSWRSPTTDLALSKLPHFDCGIPTSDTGFYADLLFSCIVFAIPLLLILIFDLIYKAWVFMDWLYQYLSPSSRSDPSVRIVGDMPRLSGFSAMAVERVSMSDTTWFTLVELQQHGPLDGVTFKLDGIPNMSNAMWAAVLNSLRLQRIPYRIHVGSNACLDPFLLQSFIRRHDSSWGPRVVLQSGALSISPGSILQPYPQPYSDGIGMLTAPAEYIPHLVHGGWRLCYLCLTTTNDLSGALTALAAQPNSDLEWLTLRIWDYHGRPTATSRKGRQT